MTTCLGFAPKHETILIRNRTYGFLIETHSLRNSTEPEILSGNAFLYSGKHLFEQLEKCCFSPDNRFTTGQREHSCTKKCNNASNIQNIFISLNINIIQEIFTNNILIYIKNSK